MSRVPGPEPRTEMISRDGSEARPRDAALAPRPPPLGAPAGPSDDRGLCWLTCALIPGSLVVRQQFVPLVLSLTTKQLAELNCSRDRPMVLG